MPLGWASGCGSQNLTGTVAGIASASTTLARHRCAAARLGAIRAGRDGSASASSATAAAAVVAFVAFGKVLSPQFLVWLLAARRPRPGAAGLAAMSLPLSACVLTRLWFPSYYWELVKQFDPTASWLVLARDLVLVALFAALLVGRCSWPGHADRLDRRRPPASGVALDEHPFDPDAARRRPRTAPASRSASDAWRARP